MLGNPRLQKRILAQMCGSRLPAVQDQIDEVLHPDRLEAVFDGDFDAIVLSMGLAWHSNRIAQMVTSGELAGALPDVSREEARDCLRYRDFGCEAKPPYPLFPEDIERDGKLALSTWVSEQPVDVQARLACLWELVPAEANEELRRFRVNVADAVLADLVAA